MFVFYSLSDYDRFYINIVISESNLSIIDLSQQAGKRLLLVKRCDNSLNRINNTNIFHSYLNNNY